MIRRHLLLITISLFISNGFIGIEPSLDAHTYSFGHHHQCRKCYRTQYHSFPTYQYDHNPCCYRRIYPQYEEGIYIDQSDYVISSYILDTDRHHDGHVLKLANGMVFLAYTRRDFDDGSWVHVFMKSRIVKFKDGSEETFHTYYIKINSEFYNTKRLD